MGDLSQILGRTIDMDRVKHYIQYNLSGLNNEEREYLSEILKNKSISNTCCVGIILKEYKSDIFLASNTDRLNSSHVSVLMK